jgi:multiple sugar transport system substrate-binding protein
MKKCHFMMLTITCFFIMGFSSVWAERSITFWTTEVEKDRVEMQKSIAADFTQKAGISVRVIPVEENLLTERVTAAFAAKSLPDVIFHPIDFTMGWLQAGILDGRAATQTVRNLGKDTFAAGPLNLVRTGDGYGAVPADGWGQLLLYRKDLFAGKNLAVPDHWDSIVKGAKALHNPPLMWGFEAATDPSQTYTQQVFEQFALSDNARLVSKRRELELEYTGDGGDTGILQVPLQVHAPGKPLLAAHQDGLPVRTGGDDRLVALYSR